MATELLSKILDGGVRNINFFEGRLLTARDLRDQQEADQRRHWQLGRAIGAGVVEGFEVEVENDGKDGSVPVVKVMKGLAVNAAGEALELSKEYVQVKLSRTLDQPQSGDDLFFTCANPPQTKQVPNGTGIYILAVSPAKGYQDYAPMSGLDDKGKVGNCGRRYKVDGLTFRLIGLDPLNLSERSISESTRKILQNDLLSPGNPAKVGETARLSKLRNIVAHLCFGTERLAQFPVDPFGSTNGTSDYRAYGALDELHEVDGGLTECDVPLALLYWTLQGIGFLDLWSVRRSPAPPRAASSSWSIVSRECRLPESLSAFLQFQDQIEWVLDAGIPQSQLVLTKAADYFAYLPACGIIPITYSYTLSYQKKSLTAMPDNGFDPGMFFAGLPYRKPLVMEGAQVRSLAHESLYYPPVYLKNKEMVWLYMIRENMGDANQAKPPFPQPYMIFTSGHVSFRASARFDVNRWNYSNYGSVLNR